MRYLLICCASAFLACNGDSVTGVSEVSDIVDVSDTEAVLEHFEEQYEVSLEIAQDEVIQDHLVTDESGVELVQDLGVELIADESVEAKQEDEPTIEDISPYDKPGPEEVTGNAFVAVNEVVAAAADKGPDWVELYAYGTGIVDLSGWVLKDNNDLHTFTFPEGTVIESGGFLIIEGEGGTGPLTLTYGFGKADSVRLYDPDGNLVDSTSWEAGQAPSGSSWGRYPDGTGEFMTLTTPTRGAPNIAP